MNLQEAKTKAKRIGRNSLIILLISGFILSVGYYYYRTYTTSEGTRSGVLYKISKKGVVFKTYEGELQLAGSSIMNKESIWKFSAGSEEVYKEIQSFEGKTVKLYYNQVVDAFIWQGETDYIVYKAEEVK